MNEVDRIADELTDDSNDIKPNDLVSRMRDELDDMISDCGDLSERRDLAYKFRMCEWEGQSDDGRKHAEDLKKEPHPFEGAPDTKVHLVDEIINEDVTVLFSAFFSGQIQAKANTFAGLADSSHVSVFTSWLRDSPLLLQLTTEVELLANMQQGDDPGVGVLGVFWEPNPRVIRKKVSVEMLVQGAAAQDYDLPREEILNPNSEKRREIMRAFISPMVSDEALDAALEAFDKEPEVDAMEFVIGEDRGLPRFQALRPGEDIWYDLGLSDIQDSRGIFLREELTSLELKARIQSQGYDKDWVEAVLKAGPNKRAIDESGSSADRDYANSMDNAREHLYEIWRCWRKEFNELALAPELRQTVFSYFVPETYGLDEPDAAMGGEYPFVEFRRETIAKNAKTSRGVSRIAGTHQLAIKTLFDCRNVAEQLASFPPIKKNMLRVGVQLALGPGREIPVRSDADLNWMPPPPNPNATMNMEETLQRGMDSYFGRVRPDGVPTRGAAVQQKMVTQWLNRWAKAMGYALKLCQYYMEPERIAAVLSVEMGKEVMPQLDQEYNLAIRFDVRNLDIEYVTKKLELIGTITSFDTNGIIDMGLVADAMYSIDPYLARTRVRDMGSATQQEAEEERMALVEMAAGLEPKMHERGQNFQLRLQTLQGELQKSPQLMQRYEQDEAFRKLVDTRMQHLGNQANQFGKNAQTGRVGAEAVQG